MNAHQHLQIWATIPPPQNHHLSFEGVGNGLLFLLYKIPSNVKEKRGILQKDGARDSMLWKNHSHFFIFPSLSFLLLLLENV
jgi:hypothetical protein